MGIKDHKAKIRMFSIIFIIGFALSSIYGAWMFLKNNVFNNPSSNREVIAEVNGNKIYKDEIEKEFQNMKNYADSILAQKKQQLSQMGVDTKDFQSLPDEVLKEYLLKTLVDRKILLSSSKELKVNVSNGDIEKQVADIQKQAGGKDKLIQYLMANGYNLTTFKEQLKNEMVITKVQEKIQSSLKITDEELKKTYERYKYENFADQTFEEAKPQIMEILNSENGTMLVSSYIYKAETKAKINFKSDEYKKIYENSKAVIAEKEGYKFTKANLNESIISTFFFITAGIFPVFSGQYQETAYRKSESSSGYNE